MLEVGRSCSSFVHVKNSIYLQTRSLNWLWLKWTNSSFAFFLWIFLTKMISAAESWGRIIACQNTFARYRTIAENEQKPLLWLVVKILYGQKYLVSNKGFFIYTLALKADVYECVQEWFWVFFFMAASLLAGGICTDIYSWCTFCQLVPLLLKM